MTSKIGELEHLFDMLFEYSWWLSLGWVLGNGNVDSPAFMAAVGLVFLNFADSLTGVFFWFTLGQTHNRILDNYTPFELSVRKISGRRNTYVWLLLLAGPFIGVKRHPMDLRLMGSGDHCGTRWKGGVVHQCPAGTHGFCLLTAAPHCSRTTCVTHSDVSLLANVS